MTTVAVIMSTYNGEKFLREQLDSIFCQEDVTVRLHVRDDGSSDETRNILTAYADTHADMTLDFGTNVGVGNSFMEALYTAPDDCNYYAFADQDDIWEPRKLTEAVQTLQANPDKLLYASNQESVDKDNVSLGLRYSADTDVHVTLEKVLVRNMLAGCTMVFTAELFSILRANDYRPAADLLKNRIHDVWVAAVASLYNGIVYDERSFIRYRQHGNNVVGAKESRMKRLKQRFKKLHHRECRNGRSLLAKALTEQFPDVAANHPILAVCADNSTFRGKRKILRHRKELRDGESAFGFWIKVMFGLF
ncbi:MAG: glycosyltransferase [Clostridiales bacterium]|nr:glycosyltransferase [Clostridiales bacterium]